jgi:diadenosine tetraphosphatase ApaH/serine/threonine PP2A family protein phosphatase
MPTRTAIISDLHSNLEALTAVFADIDARGITEVWCLGDIVGYGPQPVECLDLVMQRCTVSLMGNHDEAVIHGAFGFNSHAREAIEYTRRLLKPSIFKRESRRRWRYLTELATFHREGADLFFHASPREPTTEYVLPNDARGPSASQKLNAIFGMIDRLCYIGHTHIPGVFTEDCEFVPPDVLGGRYVIDGSKAVINVGSVGQPRDGNPDACYVEIDLESGEGEGEVIWHRVPYERDRTAQKIRDTGQLDERLAARLGEGR